MKCCVDILRNLFSLISFVPYIQKTPTKPYQAYFEQESFHKNTMHYYRSQCSCKILVCSLFLVFKLIWCPFLFTNPHVILCYTVWAKTVEILCRQLSAEMIFLIIVCFFPVKISLISSSSKFYMFIWTAQKCAELWNTELVLFQDISTSCNFKKIVRTVRCISKLI